MFIITPIMINSSLTSKRAHVCSSRTIAESLMTPKISQVFPRVVLLGFSRVREKEIGFEPPFHSLCVRDIYLFIDIILQIPTVGIF